jgi:quinol-cytochrome oxidoreductase complex cytochrome b subunit
MLWEVRWGAERPVERALLRHEAPLGILIAHTLCSGRAFEVPVVALPEIILARVVAHILVSLGVRHGQPHGVSEAAVSSARAPPAYRLK